MRSGLLDEDSLEQIDDEDKVLYNQIGTAVLEIDEVIKHVMLAKGEDYECAKSISDEVETNENYSSVNSKGT